MLRLQTPLCPWIEDFFMNWPKYIRMDTYTSSTTILNTGVPQGCFQTHLLFTLYTHDCVATHGSEHPYQVCWWHNHCRSDQQRWRGKHTQRRSKPWWPGAATTNSTSTSGKQRCHHWILEVKNNTAFKPEAHANKYIYSFFLMAVKMLQAPWKLPRVIMWYYTQ